MAYQARGGKMRLVPITINLPIDDIDWIDQHAQKRRVSRSLVVREAIKKYREDIKNGLRDNRKKI